jgi:hypothetical protein
VRTLERMTSMNKVELYANYALRDLLPVDLRKCINGKVERTKENTIMIHFNETKSHDMFLTLCNQYGFKTRMIIDK